MMGDNTPPLFDKNSLFDGVSIEKFLLCVKKKAKRRIENLGSLF
jgi:hypothetical protein